MATKDKRKILGLVVAHPGHDPVYDAIMGAFRHLGWLINVVVPPNVKKIYEDWHQPVPDCQEIHYLDGDGDDRSVVKKISDLASEHFECLIYDDYHGRPEIFKDYHSRCPSLLIAHNLKGAFEKFPGRGFDVIDKNRPRRAGIRRLDGMIVLSETIWNYARDIYHPVKPLYWMPDSLHLLQRAIAENHASDDKMSVFAIPGNLTKVRKEYPPLFEMLAGLKTESRKKCEFRFIGGIGDDSGKEVADKLEQLQKGGVPLTYNTELLSDTEFEEKMRNVDALILPAPHSIRVGNFDEEYNRTKISGTVGHQIRRGLPIFQPDWCPCDKAFESSTSYYENGADLLKQLEHLINNTTELRVMKELALQSARDFTTEKIAEHLNESILKPMFLAE